MSLAVWHAGAGQVNRRTVVEGWEFSPSLLRQRRAAEKVRHPANGLLTHDLSVKD